MAGESGGGDVEGGKMRVGKAENESRKSDQRAVLNDQFWLAVKWRVG